MDIEKKIQKNLKALGIRYYTRKDLERELGVKAMRLGDRAMEIYVEGKLSHRQAYDQACVEILG